MGQASFQTIRLGRGKHRSPEEGACVMELASMLGGEQFSDHPQSACPVIGSFLRSYNDSLDDDRRQDLYTYASSVVGSRASEDIQRARGERLIAWIRQLHARRWTRLLLPGRVRALAPKPLDDMLGPHVVRALGAPTDRTHAEALAVLDELLAMGTATTPAAVPALTSRSARRAAARTHER